MKNYLILPLLFVAVLLVIPLSVFLLTSPSAPMEIAAEGIYTPAYIMEGMAEPDEERVIPVLRYATSSIEYFDLEAYVKGVVASEMPASFEPAALQAQAVAARTYALRTLQSAPHILDTVSDQVFKDEGQLRSRWGEDFDKHFEKISDAVNETKGLVMTYNDRLINALFFSMSNGRTENSEDVFGGRYSYLRSVESPWELGLARFEVQEEFTLEQLRHYLDDPQLTETGITILNRSQGGNVLEVQIGQNVISGRDFRRKLNLRSADFSVQPANNIVVITTRGHGHGVGMSQYGANELAKQGKSFSDILHFYYQGIEIAEKN